MTETSYKGASYTARELSSWLPALSSADRELFGELQTLVARSRDLIRNNGIASGAVQTLVDNVVGGGFKLVSIPDNRILDQEKEWLENWARKVEALWRVWTETNNCDASGRMNFNTMTEMIFRTSVVSGEALALVLWLPQQDCPFATRIQLIEPDHLSNPNNTFNTPTLRDGVEINQYGEPQAYHITKYHPTDYSGVNYWQRIPAKTSFGRKRILHVYDMERVGQSRGKPLFASIMPLFKMLDHYERSELQASVVNAMIAAFIETPLDGESLAELFGGTTKDYLEARKEWNIKLQGGSVISMFPGDKVAPFTPSRPNSAFGAFVENVLRHIGTGLNIPLELLTKDFSKTNYSSARASLLEAWRFFNSRRLWLAHNWARPVYELFLEECVNKGLIEAPDFYKNKASWSRCKWIGAGRGWIDPVKEAQASQLRMEIGLSTLEDECASQGLDWEEVLEQRAREQIVLKNLGLFSLTEKIKKENTNEDIEQTNE